jgi:hypothetical protein
LYPLGVIIDFWEEIAYYQSRWYIEASHKTSLLVKFIGKQARKSNKSIMLVGFFGFPHGFELLEGNIHDQDVPPSGELMMLRPQRIPLIPIFPLDPRPTWGTLTKFQALVSKNTHQA